VHLAGFSILTYFLSFSFLFVSAAAPVDNRNDVAVVDDDYY